VKPLRIIAAMTVAIWVFVSPVAYADIADGSYDYDFSGIVPLWDISGNYSGGVAGLELDFPITEGPSGAFTGGGPFDYDDGFGDVLDGTINVSGAVKQSDTDPRVSMDMLISGTGTVVDPAGNTNDVTYAASAKLVLAIDIADGELVATSGSVSVTEKDLTTGKKERASESLVGGTLTLPEDATGGWNLTLNLTPNGTKYTGTATVQTSTGGTAEFTATGSYESKTDTSNITLKGTADDSLKLVISTSGSLMNIQSMNGQLFGQRVNFKTP
jgi:hypothetical protein